MTSDKICSVCGRTGIYHCGCKVVFYCSWACGMKHLKEHQPNCSRMAKGLKPIYSKSKKKKTKRLMIEEKVEEPEENMTKLPWHNDAVLY
jgi:hypothetical protein